ncbi:hypothetical protein ABH897_005596 [Paenibacillus sp. RC73]|uniref:hypothetical protein n=1 Tax=Paenibacillus sp. RC73 TaxID=3156250 RepID=UPI0038336A11
MAVPTAAVSVDLTGVKVPFTVGDMITTGMSFLGIFDTWILIGLGVVFAGLMAGFIYWIVAKAKKHAPGSGK